MTKITSSMRDHFLAMREHRRRELWHELTDLSERFADLVSELMRYEPQVAEPRWRDPMQLELPLRKMRGDR